MPFVTIDRLRVAPALTTALCGLVGAGWALRALAHPQVPSPSSRQTSTLPAPPTTPAAQKSAPPPSGNQSGSGLLSFSNGYRGEGRTSIVIGHAFVYTEKDAKITGDNGKWDDENKLLDADGHLVFDDTTHHATGDRAHINDKSRIADITGNVVLVLKPAPAPPAAVNGTKDGARSDDADENRQSLKQHGVTVTCDRLRDLYGRKYVKLYGHLVFTQKFADASGKPIERVLTAEHAEYDGKIETMTLFPPVAGHDNRGQKISSDTPVKIGTHEGDEWIEGTHTVMTFQVHHDESPDTGSGDDTESTTTSSEGGAKPAPPPPSDGKTPPAAPPKNSGR